MIFCGVPAKMFRVLLRSLPESFLHSAGKKGNKDIPAVAFTHTPYLDFLPNPAKYYSCFTPIHLNGFGWVIGQWYKHIAHLAFEFCHRPSYRSFTAIKTTFGNQACVYLMCCMLLLPQCFLVRIQALHDKCFDIIGDDVIFCRRQVCVPMELFVLPSISLLCFVRSPVSLPHYMAEVCMLSIISDLS